jgi:predicted nuclease of predicted toxin-antitoxin system
MEAPKKLLIVSTGNINNQNLIRLFEKNLDTLKSLFEEHSVIEINEEEIQVHYWNRPVNRVDGREQ